MIYKPFMESSVKFNQSLCSICQDVLLVNTSDASKDFVKATGQTFEVFREAVKSKCIICLMVWQLSREYRHMWSETPSLWLPMTFRASKAQGEGSVISLHVSYVNHSKNEVAVAHFYLIPTNGAF